MFRKATGIMQAVTIEMNMNNSKECLCSTDYSLLKEVKQSHLALYLMDKAYRITFRRPPFGLGE
jgi:hypothetical protein